MTSVATTIKMKTSENEFRKVTKQTNDYDNRQQQQQALEGRENLIPRAATKYHQKCFIFNNQPWDIQRNRKV